MRRIVLAVLSFTLVACASARTADTAASTADVSATRDQSRLTAAEIAAADLPTAYDLVERLRRSWLRRQGTQGGEVVVYRDGQSLGGADKLREILSVDVGELQYLANEDAMRQLGSQITGAVIVVVRRR